MPARASMIQVRVDVDLKAQATEALLGVGLTADPEVCDARFRADVRKALDDQRYLISYD